MANKLCLIYNFAQHYRSEIFQAIDAEYDCDFFFGDSYLDVKKMDYALIKNGRVTEVHNRYFGPAIYQEGIPSLMRKYDTFLMTGETHAISTWLFLFYSRFFKNKHIYFWNHGWYGKETKMQTWLKKVFYKMTTGIFVYSYYAKDLMEKAGIPADKVHVIHNSLAYSKQIEVRKQLSVLPIYKAQFCNDNPNLMFVGRLTPVKKLDMILRAMHICKQQGKYYNMTFIGGGEMMEELKALTKDLGLEEQVWFYGPCYDEKILGDMIYNADLCVAPGNVGLTAMHTMVFGCPVITHNDFKWQMPEFEAIRDGMTGCFFTNGDLDSLVEQINKWFEQKSDKREDVREACMKEIDDNWTPAFQMSVFRKNIKFN